MAQGDYFTTNTPSGRRYVRDCYGEEFCDFLFERWHVPNIFNDLWMKDKLNLLNEIGFNFSNVDYIKMLNKLNGLNLDMTDFESTSSLDVLITLGFHFSSDYSFNWLDSLSKMKLAILY